MSQTLIKWPSRSRPKLVADHLPLWDQGGVRFLFSLDSDDPALPAYRDLLYGRENVQCVEGTSTGKVHAINRDMEHADTLFPGLEPWSFCILASDDFVPQRPDYAKVLADALFAAFPDGDGVVQIPDGRRTDNLNTCPIFGRAWYERFGYIYNPIYTSTHCDDELTEVSHRLSRFVQLDEVVLFHKWVGEHHPDDLHAKNERSFSEDAKTFARRREWSFPA